MGDDQNYKESLGSLKYFQILPKTGPSYNLNFALAVIFLAIYLDTF